MSPAAFISLSEHEVSRFFLAIVLLLLGAHGFAYFFQKYGLPKVIGEIFGGLILGPTVLGYFSPEKFAWIFNGFVGEGKLLSAMYWMGLVLLMFISGFEVQSKFNKEDKKLIIALIVGATAIPFFAGWFAPNFYDFSHVIGPKQNLTALKIIIAMAASITSIPVISKIFMDLGIMGSRFARVVLAAAATHDIVLWVALAIATGLVSTRQPSISSLAVSVGSTLGFFVVSLLLMPKLFRTINRSRYNIFLKHTATGYVLLICLVFVALASLLQVNVVFGALLAGTVVGLMPKEKFGEIRTHIREISVAFFIPLYFAVVGLKLDLVHHFDFIFFLGFFAFTAFFETLGSMIAAWWVLRKWLPSINLAVAMNARGGPGIVLATVAFDLGIINETFFAVLIVIAIVSSLLAGQWFSYVLTRKWKLL